MNLRSFGVLAAVLLGTAASMVGVAAPAHAAACAPGTGVTVVVNSGVRCDPDGGTGERASKNFADAGHSLSFASRSGGFVCRVDGQPADDPCTEASPSDAYWALFWSDGTSGTWAYASLGVGSLRAPKGGAVAFVFQKSESKTFPAVPAPVAAPPSSPGSDSGAPKPSKKPKKTKKSPAPTARATSEPAVVPSADTSPSPTPTPSASASSSAPTVSPSATTAPTADATIATSEPSGSVDRASTETESGGISPAVGVAGLVVLFLLGLAGAIVWRRRQDV